jgi:hypothetical protein
VTAAVLTEMIKETQCTPLFQLRVFPCHRHFVNPLNAELNPICYLLVLLGDLTFMGPCIVSIVSGFCNVCVCVGFVMCGCLGNMYTVL